MGQLRADLAYTPIDDIITAGLHEFIDGLQSKLNQIGESVHDTFFAMRTYNTGLGQRQFQSQ